MALTRLFCNGIGDADAGVAATRLGAFFKRLSVALPRRSSSATTAIHVSGANAPPLLGRIASFPQRMRITFGDNTRITGTETARSASNLNSRGCRRAYGETRPRKRAAPRAYKPRSGATLTFKNGHPMIPFNVALGRMTDDAKSSFG